jgi:hypothetical protein
MPKDWKPQPYWPRKADANFSWFEHATPAVEDNLRPSNKAVENYTKSTYFVKPYSDDLREKVAQEFFLGHGPICPTFPGGEALVGECIFTQPSVRDTILTFFEKVSKPSSPNVPSLLWMSFLDTGFAPSCLFRRILLII